MDAVSESRFTYDLRRASQNGLFSRVLAVSAQRAIRRSQELCQVVHERRIRPEFLSHLAKYARTAPRLRRYLPLAGGESGLLHIETEERPEGLVAHVAGEVDLANVIDFKDAIQPAVSTGRNVILDVSQLRYLDSTGLYVIADAHKALQQHNRQLVVAGAARTIAKVMGIFGFDRLVPLLSTRH